MTRKLAWLLSVIATLSVLSTGSAVKLTLPLNTIKLPKGFSIALYTNEKVPGPRQLALSHGYNSSWPDASIVYVGTTNESTVRLCR